MSHARNVCIVLAMCVAAGLADGAYADALHVNARHPQASDENPGTALRLDLWCRENRVEGNHIDRMGGTGILLCGYGPGTRDVNKQNTVANNHIHHCGQIYWHAAGIFVWQSGRNRIANNLVHHLPYTGGKQPFYCEARNRRAPEWSKNLAADYNVYYAAADPASGAEFLAGQQADGVDAHSLSADPGFVKLGPGDFRLEPDSPALELGFRPIDTSRIGLKQE